MVNIEKIEADIDARMAEERVKTIKRIVKSLEAIQSDVILVVEFNRIMDSMHMDLIIAAHEAVSARIVDIITTARDDENSAAHAHVNEFLDLGLKTALASLGTVSGGDISKH